MLISYRQLFSIFLLTCHEAVGEGQQGDGGSLATCSHTHFHFLYGVETQEIEKQNQNQNITKKVFMLGRDGEVGVSTWRKNHGIHEACD